MKLHLTYAAAPIFALLVGNSYGLEVSAFEQLKMSDRETVKLYINGLGVGMSWANAELAVRGDKQLFCLPKTLSPNPENYMELVEGELRGRATRAETTAVAVELVLLRAMQRTFPCAK